MKEGEARGRENEGIILKIQIPSQVFLGTPTCDEYIEERK